MVLQKKSYKDLWLEDLDAFLLALEVSIIISLKYCFYVHSLSSFTCYVCLIERGTERERRVACWSGNYKEVETKGG